ncbi:MAG: hypothetical protein LPK85_11330, partial [Gammaproteobacteria bacterium]|nr:hypothetical protein [Gammaproteobacteria bacterium]
LAPAQDEPRSGQLIVHALAGGKAPDKRCEPAIFLTNDTNTALHAAVLRHRWVTEAGEIGDATGSLVVRLAAGKTAFVALAALEQPCAQLTLKVENLSCRDDQAQPGQCPGSLQGQSFGMKGLQLP